MEVGYLNIQCDWYVVHGASLLGIVCSVRYTSLYYCLYKLVWYCYYISNNNVSKCVRLNVSKDKI